MKMRQEASWKITEEFWEAAAPYIPTRKRDENREYKRRSGGGRPGLPPRLVLEGIFYVLRTGIQWKALPKEYGASSSIHRYFRFWCEEGFFEAIWRAGLTQYDEMVGIDWTWLSGDGCMTKAPLAQESVGRNPTDRGKNGEQTASPRRRQRGTTSARDNGGEPT